MKLGQLANMFQETENDHISKETVLAVIHSSPTSQELKPDVKWPKQIINTVELN